MRDTVTKPARNLIGPQLRELRRLLRPRITQEDLCGRVAKYGVTLTRTQVVKIETGRRPVTDIELVALAAALKAAPSDLLPRRVGTKATETRHSKVC